MQGPSPVPDGPEPQTETSPEASDARAALVTEAVERWRAQMVDLSAGNALLHFRDGGRGHLDLGSPSETIGALLGGGGRRVSRSVVGTDPGEALVRARAIRAKAIEAMEERGLSVLFVTYGMATWADPTPRATPPLAPLVLLPVRLEPFGTAVPAADHLLRMDGDPHINPTLLMRLATDFGVQVDQDAVDAALAGATALRELDAVVAGLAGDVKAVPRFQVQRRSVLATFSYVKLPMVRDLERARDALVGDDLVAAIAGDEDARGAVRDRQAAAPAPGDADRVPPDREHLVLDADATQQHAIAHVLAGDDLVIHGPPGTGKSQTIANMIAALTAEGRSVLFVSEKRAAIEAVFGRLRAAGLGDLLLDMRDVARRPRHDLARFLWSTADEVVPEPPDLTETHLALERTRRELSERDAAQHATRDPWGVTAFGARTRRAELGDGASTDLRLTGPSLEALDAAAFREARAALSRWFAAGDGPGPGRWASARVQDQDDLETARLAVEAAVTALPRARRLVETVAARTSLPLGGTLADWERVVSLAGRAADLAAMFDPGIYQEDLVALCAGFERGMTTGLRRLVTRLGPGDPRVARDTVRGMLVAGGDPPDREVLAGLQSVRDLLGDWRRASNAYAVPVAADAGPAAEALAAVRDPLEALRGIVPEEVAPDRDLTAVEEDLRTLSRDAAGLRSVMEMRRAEALLDAAHLGPLLDEVRADRLDRATAVARLEWMWLTSILEHVGLTDRHVGITAGPDPEVEEFVRADRRHIEAGGLVVRRIAAEALARARDEHPDEVLVLQRQAALSSRSGRHMPLRDLFDAAPAILRALRPCWAMSPLVVSQVLPARPDLFDVVIFDEASQVPPHEAIPAILRGRRLVVSGDRLQLPPSAFFAAAFPDEEDDDGAPEVGTEGYESILDAMAGLVPEVMLRWHYRSRDERLIAFSNANVYEGLLTTFPSAGGERCVRHEIVDDAADEDGGTSAGEVRRVVELVLEHAATRPDESLGVIALSARHAEDLERAIRRAHEEGCDDLERLLSEAHPEPLFVKNLERVQGDERDAIILSIGYGRDPRTGRPHHRFGPLLTEGGERRLNVAITRARRRVTVVSSFSHTELDPDRLVRPGARMLHDYLEYAAAGGELDLGGSGAAGDGDRLSRDIAAALTRAGVPVVRGVGASVHRIDLAAVHPDHPGVGLLAIEHDGPAYHRLPTTRARDRLRAEQLTRAGWIHRRVWAGEWYADPGTACARLVRAWEAAVEEHDRRTAAGQLAP